MILLIDNRRDLEETADIVARSFFAGISVLQGCFITKLFLGNDLGENAVIPQYIVELESEVIRLHSPVHPIPVTLDEAKECIAIFRNSLWDQEVEHRKRHKADADTIKELREKYESTN
jgi:hypothetical protein